jgi:uncharacterized protein YjdB
LSWEELGKTQVKIDPSQNDVQLTGRLGVITTQTHTVVSVNATSTQLLAANTNRLYACLVNDSDEVIYIKFGVVAVLNEGIRLNANGGTYEMSKELGNLYTGSINAISVSGSKNMLVTEGV